MLIETFEEPGEWDCPLCPDPVVRLDEVVVIATDLVAHAECYLDNHLPAPAPATNGQICVSAA